MQYLWTFLVGGAICCIGQVLIEKTNLTSARILVIFVTAGGVLPCGASGRWQRG